MQALPLHSTVSTDFFGLSENFLMNSVMIRSITVWERRLLDVCHVHNCQHLCFLTGCRMKPIKMLPNVVKNQAEFCLGGNRHDAPAVLWEIIVTSRLGSCSSAMSNSPAFFLLFCLLALFSSTNADVGSMIDKAVSSSQDKTQENISRLWILHESHFWLCRCGRQANTEVIYQRRKLKVTLERGQKRVRKIYLNK